MIKKLAVTSRDFDQEWALEREYLTLETIMERYLEFGMDVYICFIDYEKAFDRVYHEQIMKCLDRMEMDDKDKRLIGTIYWEQKAAVRLEQGLSETIEIKRGVRQGCVFITYTFQSIYRIQFPRK